MTVQVVPAFPGRGVCDDPNLGVFRDLLARILFLLQTPFVRLVLKQMCDGRRLIKVGQCPEVIDELFLEAQGSPSKADGDQG